MIDPTIWADEDFGSLDSNAQIMFIGMFSNADDEGRLPGNALFLASTIMPYKGLSKEEATALRDSVLQQMHSIALYIVDGKEYLQFKKWVSYQAINRPTASKYPVMPEGYKSPTPPLIEDSVSNHGSLTPNRIEGKGIEKKRIETGKSPEFKKLPQGMHTMSEMLADRFDNIKPASTKPEHTTGGGITRQWQDQCFRECEKMGIKLDDGVKPRVLKIYKQAYELGRKTANLRTAFSYLVDYPGNLTNTEKLNFLFHIYENGLKKDFGT